MFSFIDAYVLNFFQNIANKINVVIVVNSLVLIMILNRLFFFGEVNSFDAIMIGLLIFFTVIGTNHYNRIKEGHRNDLAFSLFTLRILIMFFLLLHSIMIDFPLMLNQILELVAVYLISTDKEPKPPKKTADNLKYAQNEGM